MRITVNVQQKKIYPLSVKYIIELHKDVEETSLEKAKKGVYLRQKIAQRSIKRGHVTTNWLSTAVLRGLLFVEISRV